MGTIQSALNQGISVASAVATQSPEFQRKKEIKQEKAEMAAIESGFKEAEAVSKARFDEGVGIIKQSAELDSDLAERFDKGTKVAWESLKGDLDKLKKEKLDPHNQKLAGYGDVTGIRSLAKDMFNKSDVYKKIAEAISKPQVNFDPAQAQESQGRVSEIQQGIQFSTPRFDDMGNRVGDNNG